MTFALDPQLAAVIGPFLAAVPEVEPPPAGDWKARRVSVEAALAQMIAALPAPEDVATTDYEINSHDGAIIALRWYTARESMPGTAVLYFHGGGMILGSVGLYDPWVARYVSATGVPMLSVEYRLAPEHPHPTPVEDCYAALRWLADHAVELGVDPARIAVMGDSGGGGLAAAVALLARDRGGPALARQILIYPMLDDRNTTPDPAIAPFAGWNYDDNITGWGALLGMARGGPDVPPYAAPARADDLTGLPPAYVEVGELDIFRDESIEYARRLAMAGVSIELHVHPGAPHGFDALGPETDIGQRATADRVRVLTGL
ncbi:Alpha/beta hydrolase fold-3 domain protein [Parafrankia sp. EAN1pec]|uniref:alpha/beta hydrolase n=1 Tax=Parafrankia sp. (strain EAN1pec) TaxID=298653 RepID=UPI0000541083|nr:Alpha/beta hydrolase fold-3 domain protein [Frankia sp. EAN1pec]